MFHVLFCEERTEMWKKYHPRWKDSEFNFAPTLINHSKKKKWSITGGTNDKDYSWTKQKATSEHKQTLWLAFVIEFLLF